MVPGVVIEERHGVRRKGGTVVADDDRIVVKTTLTPNHDTRDIVVEDGAVTPPTPGWARGLGWHWRPAAVCVD